MRVLIAGPLPDPIDGCSYANLVLQLALRSRGFTVEAVNTAARVINGHHGRFSLRKVLAFVLVYRGLPGVARTDVVYLTPGQTFFGLIKYAPFMVLAKVFRKPYVIHLHGNHLGAHYAHLKGLKRVLFRLCVQGAAAGIVLSESLRANFEGLLPASSVFVVENFAGDALFEPPEHAKPADRLHVLFLSNLMRDKGVLVLLEALQRLKRRGVDFHARLAGQLEAGIEEDVRLGLANLGESTAYIGPVRDEAKRRVLEEANVFVLPTHYPMEGQPISLLEGLATGNVIVTTRHAGIPDIVGPENGFLIPVRDAEALADTLQCIADDLPNTLTRFSESNRSYARSRFTETEFALKIVGVLESVTDSRDTPKSAPHEPT